MKRESRGMLLVFHMFTFESNQDIQMQVLSRFGLKLRKCSTNYI